MIENKDVISALTELPGNRLLKSEELYGMLTLTVEAELIHGTLQFLKEASGLEFGFLTDLCGVHYPDNELPFCVVYHLHNMKEQTRIRVKAFLPAVPEIDSVSDIFSAANWMERETYDFYGIIFRGHPNLIRILNVEYLDYFPMRKEYPLEDSTREDKDNRYFGREANR